MFTFRSVSTMKVFIMALLWNAVNTVTRRAGPGHNSPCFLLPAPACFYFVAFGTELQTSVLIFSTAELPLVEFCSATFRKKNT